MLCVCFFGSEKTGITDFWRIFVPVNSNIMKNLIGIMLCSTALLCSCKDKGGTFEINGHISSAEDKTVYFEAVTLDGINTLDSAQLEGNGDFRFKGPRPSNPEFFRLRVDEQIINLSIDSTETVHIEADLPAMATDYQVKGSRNCEVIKELSLRQIDLQKRIEAIYTNRQLMMGEQERLADELIGRYKEDIRQKYILENLSSAPAYFALFQTIGNVRIFNIANNPEDIKYAAAVATAWETYYPGTPRTENLHNITIRGMENTKRPAPFTLEGLDESKISMTGIIDIDLPDLQGRHRRLSDIRDKVVLLDFTAYLLPQSKERILQLRQLYGQYAEKGFEIYQVSIDPDEHYWKTACEHLPWLCVYEERGEESDYLRLYQVTALPTYFLINRQGDLVARTEQIPDLKKAVKELCEK